MRSFVNLQVLGPGEHLPTTREGTGEGLLARMNPDVVDQLVFGLEGPPIPAAALPAARVRGALRPSHVLHGQMRHYLMHRAEVLPAVFPRSRLVGLDP